MYKTATTHPGNALLFLNFHLITLSRQPKVFTMASAISASMIKAPVAARQTALTQANKSAKPAMVSNVNAKKTNAFLVWTPTDNKVCSIPVSPHLL